MNKWINEWLILKCSEKAAVDFFQGHCVLLGKRACAYGNPATLYFGQ